MLLLFKVGAADISLRYLGCYKDDWIRDISNSYTTVNGVEQCARSCHQQGWYKLIHFSYKPAFL